MDRPYGKEEINKEGIEILYPMAASLTKGQLSALDESVGLFGLVQDAFGVVRKYNSYEKIVEVAGKCGEEGEAAANALKIMHEKAANAPRQGLYNGLKWGFTVFTVLLAAADIAITAYSLYQYYNVEHTPIPHHMVDLSYGENKESAYVAYMSVGIRMETRET